MNTSHTLVSRACANSARLGVSKSLNQHYSRSHPAECRAIRWLHVILRCCRRDADKLKRSRVFSTVHQDILPGDESGMLATQECTGSAEFVDRTHALRWVPGQPRAGGLGD